MIDIISKNNDKIKDLIKIRDDKKFRKDKSLFYVEGERIITNISNDLIDSLYISKSKVNDYKNIYNKIDDAKIYILSDEVFNKAKDTINSQGIIALVKNRATLNANYTTANRILVLDNIKDPGNLGTIIRSSEAARIDLIILTNECCDIYNPKTVRSSMSSITRVNIIVEANIINVLKELKDKGLYIYSSYLNDNSIDLYKVKFNEKFVIIIGSEAIGIRKELIDISNAFIKIPMNGKIESLNASTAASIIIYEVYRQHYEN